MCVKSLIAAALLLVIVAADAGAGLPEEMNDMFDSLVNLSAPTAHEGMRRGAITGGNVFIRNRIMSPNIVSFVPPRFSGGCGGIDMFGGSFSFINSAEFEQLLRSIAANAQGLLFQMALDAIDPGLATKLSDFQRKIQALNQKLSNSCQIAKGLITDVKDAFQGKQLNKSGLIMQTAGAAGDAFQALLPQDGTSPTENAAAAAPAETAKDVEGNIVWKALKGVNAIGWFVNGDTDLMEAIMSYTGTIIVRPLAAGQKEYEPEFLAGNMISLRDLVFGNAAAQIYDCGADADCLNPTTQNVNLKGLTERIQDLLLNAGGLIDKMRTNVGAIDADEKGFMNVSRGLGGMIRNLVIADQGLARIFINQAGPMIATELTGVIVDDMVQAVQIALFTENNAWTKEVVEMARDARGRLVEQKSELAKRYGSLTEMYSLYNDFMKDAKTRPYSVGGLSGK